MEKENESRIGKLIHDELPIEWMRYKMFHIEDRFMFIPFLVFRFEEYYEKKDIEKLCECIEQFEGKQKWKLFRYFWTRRDNYLLTLDVAYKKMAQCYKEGRDYKEKEEFKNCYKQLCEEAIEDVPKLAEHLKAYFDNQKKY